MGEEVIHFGVWDYVVFAIMLLLSALIGVYSAFSGGRQRTAKEFFLGDGSISIFPIAVSVMVSFVSAVSVIGTPGEIYMYDIMYIWSLIMAPVGNFLVARLLIPVFFRLGITSVYEYLEMRFNRTIRLTSAIMFGVNTMLYMGIAMYTPALAINAVTGMSLWACVVSTGLVCIFYTSVGGMKAVLWTDTLQTFIILMGVLAVIIKGTMEVGGMGEVWRIGVEGNRIRLWNDSNDLHTIYSIWSVVFGYTTMSFGKGLGQTVAQRLFSAGTKKKAVQVLCLVPIMHSITIGLCIWSGVVMYAYYQTCDPYTSGKVIGRDQIMPLMVMDLFGDLPGLPGIFLSAVLSASLSTLSSGINSIVALTGEDGVRLIWPDIKPRTYAIVVKILAIFYGLVAIGFAFIASKMGTGVLQLALSLFGIICGGFAGVFLLGIYMHRCNSKGALAGLIIGTVVPGWLKIGAIMYPNRKGPNTLSVEGCLVYNSTGYMYNASDTVTVMETTWVAEDSTMYYSSTPEIEVSSSQPAITALYHISFLYYSVIGMILCIAVGIAVSALTGHVDPETVDPRLYGYLTDALFWWLPEHIKTKMRGGPPTIGFDDDEEVNVEHEKKFVKLPQDDIDGSTEEYLKMPITYLPRKMPYETTV